MSTRSSARNLFPPLDNPDIIIRRRSRADPTLLNDFEMAAEGNGDLPVPDLRTMEELCQPSLNGRSIKVNGVTDDTLRLYLFPHSLTHHATAWRPEKRYDLIENITAYHNDWDTSSQQSESSSSITSSSDLEIVALKAKMEKINKNLIRVLQVNQQVKAVTPNCELVVVLIFTVIVQPSLAKPRTYMLREPIKFMKMNTDSSSGSRTLPGNTVTNSKEDLKGITTRSGTAYQGTTIPTTSSSLSPVVERETEATKDKAPPTNNESTKDVQPPVVQTETPIPNFEPVVAPIIEPIVALVSASKRNQKPSISFADALILMPKFSPTIKTLLTNKDKLFELARTPLNKHCSAVLLKKLTEKLRDPGKFLIPCDFPGMDECLALADLSASINLMPLSVWNKLSLPELSPTCMTLELADHSISRPVGVVEDVFIKVKENQEKDKIRSKPDKKQEAWQSREKSKAVTIDKARKTEENAKRMVKNANTSPVIHHPPQELSIQEMEDLKQQYLDELQRLNVIAKHPYPTIVKGVRSFLGHAGFYRRFIQDFSKIARPMTHLLEKETPFVFFMDCIDAFETLKKKLTEASILVVPDWNLPFELMCDASEFVIGAVLGQRVVLGQHQEKHFRPIHYASKTITEAESNYTMTEKEMLAVVYAFEKFRSYLIMNKSIVYMDHFALKYLFAKKDSKARLLRWVLLL
nr:reverse transcriptase domain-containing protein [Tanacetum cinerariifolium]